MHDPMNALPARLATCLLAATAAAGAPVDADREEAARVFLATLEPDELAAATTPFDHASRHGWSFFPAKRTTLRIGDLDSEERTALRAFLLVALGEPGVRRLEEVLEVEPVSDRGGGVVTGPEEYHLVFFGPPRSEGRWGWRLEGHHVALNQTLVDGRVVTATPSFLGSAPQRNAAGLEPLRREAAAAAAVLATLDEPLRSRAVRPKVPPEVVSGMGVDWTAPPRTGLPMDRAPEATRDALRELARTHVSVHAEDVQRAFLDRWDRTPPDRIHFAWFGSPDARGGHGYRLQGPEWIMEYVNVQAGADHVHTVWRTLEGEFVPILER